MAALSPKARYPSPRDGRSYDRKFCPNRLLRQRSSELTCAPYPTSTTYVFWLSDTSTTSWSMPFKSICSEFTCSTLNPPKQCSGSGWSRDGTDLAIWFWHSVGDRSGCCRVQTEPHCRENGSNQGILLEAIASPTQYKSPTTALVFFSAVPGEHKAAKEPYLFLVTSFSKMF